jgi:hypothetical protein
VAEAIPNRYSLSNGILTRLAGSGSEKQAFEEISQVEFIQ